MSDTNDTNPSSTLTLTPAQILEKARDWGTGHGRALATMPEIREAVLADEEVDWLDYPDLFWDELGLNLDDKGLDEEFVAVAEDTAREAAQEEGERCCREMSRDEVIALIQADHPKASE